MCLNSQWLLYVYLTCHWCKCLFVVYSFFLWESLCYEYCLVSHDATIYCMLDLVDPYGRHYGLPFRSRHRILDIIPLDQLVLFDHSLLPFLLVYFFMDGRICINDVTQQCHVTRVCMRPLSLFGSIIILFFILDYFLCPRWSSYLEVDLPFSLYSSKAISFAKMSLTREALGSSSELSILVLWNDLKVKFSCMIRHIS